MTLAVLTKRIQVAVQALGLTAAVSREGDCLVVDLTGPICPDPLLAMVVVEAELDDGSATAGLEAVKLYGYAPPGGEGGDSRTPDWISVIDLDRYLAGRAALPPQAFGLEVAEASRLACAAERDRNLSRYYPSSSLLETKAEELEEAELASEPLSLEPNPSLSPISAGNTNAETEPAVPFQFDLDLNLDLEEDPWETELPEEKDTYVPFSMEHFPLVAGARSEALASDSGQRLEQSLGQDNAYGLAARAAMATAVASPTVSSDATPMASSPHTYETYLRFITDQSSWFAQTVKDNPRLHKLAKQRQHHTLGTLAHYLVDTLAGDETLVNLVPVRQRDRSCGLILTDQRAIALSQQGRRARQDQESLQVWMVPWGWVHKVEISNNALCFHYGRARERFSVDLEAPYHLRSSIPRDIPVRMVREIAQVRTKTLETKTGLAMVAGVMFALGSGFSVVNNLLQNQRLEQRPNAIALSRRAIESEASTAANASQQPTDVAISALPPVAGASDSQLAVSTPLELTTSHEQCVKSFNTAAEPHAYATLNQITQTLQVNLQNQSLGQIPPQQFNQMAASVANEILASCQAKEISHVVVTNGTHRYQQQRPDEDVSSMTSAGELKLF